MRMAEYTGPEEVVLGQQPVFFSSRDRFGRADHRSYRDFRRTDIEPHLPGWPPRRMDNPAVSVTKQTGKFLAELVGEVLTGLAGPSSGRRTTSPDERDTPNEVDDLVVMWADPGTVARDAPWQLDPSRRPPRYRTLLVVTDRRIVVVGRPGGKDAVEGEEVLWQVPRSLIAHAEVRPFGGADGEDLRIHFTDGSWVRLANGATLCKHLEAFRR